MQKVLLNILVASALLPAGPNAVASSMGMLEVGKPFPDLVLPALDDGRPLSVADYRGEKLVLHVFASW